MKMSKTDPKVITSMLINTFYCFANFADVSLLIFDKTGNYYEIDSIFRLFTLFSFSGIPYTHISSPMPDFYRSQKPTPRGVANRRAAINWIRQLGKKTGVMYFGDDDNTFDLRLFDEIRYTKRVSMFPVGLIGQYSISTPVVRDVSVWIS